MNPSDQITIAALWECAQSAIAAGLREGSPEFAFSNIGLRLDPDGNRQRYDCTPDNVSIFGWTGGDGVHWCLLDLLNTDESEKPIVCVSPLGSEMIVIAGENLRDFLELGYTTRCLDVVWGDPTEKAEFPEHEEVWEFLQRHFDLRRLSDTEKHKATLQSNYLALIRHDDAG